MAKRQKPVITYRTDDPNSPNYSKLNSSKNSFKKIIKDIYSNDKFSGIMNVKNTLNRKYNEAKLKYQGAEGYARDEQYRTNLKALTSDNQRLNIEGSAHRLANEFNQEFKMAKASKQALMNEKSFVDFQNEKSRANIEKN